MFEDSFATPKKDRLSPHDRTVGLLITLLVHAVLGFLIYQYRFTVKILSFSKESVRTVVIVPPLNVAIPKVVGGRSLADLPGGPSEGGQPGPAAKPAEMGRPEPEAPAGEPGPPGEAGQPAGGGTMPPPGSGAAIPSLSSRFQESIAIRGKSGLTIPLAPPGTPAGTPGVGGGAPLPDFSNYSRGAYRGGVGGYGTGGRGAGSGGGGSGGGGGQRVGMSIALKGYDLMPWATAVIDRIQLNWALPAVPEVPNDARISMIVIIKKTGELDSIEILEGTSIETLDRAALEALRAALPFPALPADFPGDLLEITFEFVYND
jgi:TonB family protein